MFDKTGTLTHGKLEVTDSVALAPGYCPEDLLNLAASVEEHYFHPLARQLGLDAFYADVLPEDKAAILEQMRATGARVAFVGDGVNDAPALSCAHVGISMHRGAQIARMVSDIALLEDDIARVADARALAQGNRRRVNNNFRLTVGLNSAILTAAAFGWLRPVSASMLHNGSTIGILLHALLGAGAGCGAARAGDAAGVRGVTLRRAARCIL